MSSVILSLLCCVFFGYFSISSAQRPVPLIRRPPPPGIRFGPFLRAPPRLIRPNFGFAPPIFRLPPFFRLNGVPRGLIERGLVNPNALPVGRIFNPPLAPGSVFTVNNGARFLNGNPQNVAVPGGTNTVVNNALPSGTNTAVNQALPSGTVNVQNGNTIFPASPIATLRGALPTAIPRQIPGTIPGTFPTFTGGFVPGFPPNTVFTDPITGAPTSSASGTASTGTTNTAGTTTFVASQPNANPFNGFQLAGGSFTTNQIPGATFAASGTAFPGSSSTGQFVAGGQTNPFGISGASVPALAQVDGVSTQITSNTATAQGGQDSSNMGLTAGSSFSNRFVGPETSLDLTNTITQGQIMTANVTTTNQIVTATGCQTSSCPAGQQCVYADLYPCPTYITSLECSCVPGCRVMNYFLKEGETKQVDTCGNTCTCSREPGQELGPARCTMLECQTATVAS